MYSKEDIEKKRLSALALKQKKNITLDNLPPQKLPEAKKNNSFKPNNAFTNNNFFGNKNAFNNKSGPSFKKKNQNRFNPVNSNQFYGNKTDTIVGNCIMIQNDRFAVELKKFSAPIIDVFKTIPSRAYDSPKRLWHFHLKDYEQLLEKLMRRSDCTMTPLPKLIKQIFDKKKEEVKIDLSSMDETLRESLMPFQEEGIRFGISKRGRCMIADDMGLGKTIQALGIANYYKNDWPLLIVTPSSVRYQWSEAIYKFMPSIPVQSVGHFSKTERGFEFSKITIVSYDLLARSIDIFMKQFFGVVIFDESHFLKSSKTVRHKAAKSISSQAKRVILLSGTPALSRPMELYSQISLVSPNFMGPADFGIRYCAGVKNTFGWDFSGSSNLQELDLFLKAYCLIRRIKNDVLQQLPSKLRQVVVLDPYLIKAGTKQMEEMASKLKKTTLTASERHSALLQYYSESSVAKQKAICNYITDLLEREEKFLIYAHHQGVLDAICDVINSKRIEYIRIDGKTSPEQRKYFVDRFQDEKEVLVAVLSITAANAGITLTAAQLVVFAELSWNPGILCQAEDRVHRIGQERGVVIQYLIGKNTVDDYLWPKIQRKLDVLNQVGLDQEFKIKDNDTVVQVVIDSNQKRIDGFINEDSSSLNSVPNTKRCIIPSTSTNNKQQSKMDSFVSKNIEWAKPNSSKCQESETSKISTSFADLFDEDDFCDIDLNEFP